MQSNCNNCILPKNLRPFLNSCTFYDIYKLILGLITWKFWPKYFWVSHKTNDSLQFKYFELQLYVIHWHILKLKFILYLLLQDWELLILQELRWELSTVTPLDFLDSLIQRIPQIPNTKDIRQRTETILVLALTEYKYSYINPSLLAGAALYAVLSSCWVGSVADVCDWEVEVKKEEKGQVWMELSQRLAKMLKELANMTNNPEVSKLNLYLI